jgi:hypothetical protein
MDTGPAVASAKAPVSLDAPSFGELPDRQAGPTGWWRVERPETHVEGFTTIRR